MLRPLLAAAALAAFVAACGTTEPARRGKVTLVEPEPEADAFVIARADWDAAMARGASWFIQQVVLEPVAVDRRFVGFRLLALFPGREPEVAGLQAGDVVRRVNGMPIERPDQFMKLWESLKTADHLAVEILRGREPLVVTWEIR